MSVIVPVPPEIVKQIFDLLWILDKKTSKNFVNAFRPEEVGISEEAQTWGTIARQSFYRCVTVGSVLETTDAVQRAATSALSYPDRWLNVRELTIM